MSNLFTRRFSTNMVKLKYDLLNVLNHEPLLVKKKIFFDICTRTDYKTIYFLVNNTKEIKKNLPEIINYLDNEKEKLQNQIKKLEENLYLLEQELN